MRLFATRKSCNTDVLNPALQEGKGRWEESKPHTKLWVDMLKCLIFHTQKMLTILRRGGLRQVVQPGCSSGLEAFIFSVAGMLAYYQNALSWATCKQQIVLSLGLCRGPLLVARLLVSSDSRRREGSLWCLFHKSHFLPS